MTMEIVMEIDEKHGEKHWDYGLMRFLKNLLLLIIVLKSQILH
jgi:hypothetical protein